jgi:hypothetical protein
LEGGCDDRGGSVAVLPDDQVGLVGARGFLLVLVLAVQQDHPVGVLSSESDSRRSETWGFLSVRCSGPRLSLRPADAGSGGAPHGSLDTFRADECTCTLQNPVTRRLTLSLSL